jgi:hypothetical protein
MIAEIQANKPELLDGCGSFDWELHSEPEL